jgi:hypothetical protein
MTNYAGSLQMLIWVEAENQEDADKKINLMLDNWDKATPEATTWDSVDYRLEIERECVS